MKNIEQMARKRRDEGEYLHLIDCVLTMARTFVYMGFSKSEHELREAVNALDEFERRHKMDD